ncbi:MAG: acetamidase/formamidase family protein [Thermotogota bacterium]|nr:acetamidase/formamidase family protein [Thermotogota bacterium]
MKHYLTDEKVIYEMSSTKDPVIEINCGDTIVVDTKDCFSNKIKDESITLEDNFDFSVVNPATGPIFINNAEPGDTLKVLIENISLAEKGVVEIFPGLGVLGNSVKKAKTKIVTVKDNYAYINNHKLEITPMIGVIGVAPREGNVPCGSPGSHGGNMDTLEVTTSSIVHLPVYHKGALLSLGDAHALMGNGEICGTGVEIPSKTTLTISIEKKHIDNPYIETETSFIFIASHENIDTAVETAARDSVMFISEQKNIPFEEAYMLASITCSLTFSQVVNPLKTVKMIVPKSII